MTLISVTIGIYQPENVIFTKPLGEMNVLFEGQEILIVTVYQSQYLFYYMNKIVIFESQEEILC